LSLSNTEIDEDVELGVAPAVAQPTLGPVLGIAWLAW
jgi:hypothetical protein